MADNTKPIPPVPNKADLLEPITPGQKPEKFSRKMGVVWIRWLIQLRDKINLINASIANLANFSGSGFISSDGNGNFTGRTIEGTTGNIAVTNGDGAAGNPKVNLIDTAVTPGTYANTNLTVDEFGRITDATNGSASGAPLTTKGDLFGYSTGDIRVPVGPDDYVLTADSSVPAGVAYKPAGTPTLPVTTKGDLLGYSTLPDRIPVGTDGEVLTADSTAAAGVSYKPVGTPIVQVVSIITSNTATTTSTTIAYNNSIPTSTQGTALTDYDITITPINSSSKLLYSLYIPLIFNATNGAAMRFTVFRDAGTSAIFTGYTQVANNSANNYASVNINFIVTAGSTSTTTFHLRWGVSGGTGYINRDATVSALFGGTMTSLVTIQEIL